MKIRKAVVTCAGRAQRPLPLQGFVDRDGAGKSALQIIVEEVVAAGVEEACVVVAPGDGPAYAKAAGPHAGRLTFVEQAAPGGYGQAIRLAAGFVKDEPFLHLVGDHLYLSRTAKRCAQQLVEVAAAERCAVSAVQATREHMLPFYGTIGGRRAGADDGARLYEVETVVEKPTPTEAEQRLIVPGLRAGHYLCFFGMHVLTPAVMDLLAELTAAPGGAPVPLSAALARLPGRERYLAAELAGRRQDLGVKYGSLTAQLALALDGADREDVLAQLLELVADRAQRPAT
ncbi:MAG TPA: sugar phosphate nucleotidyltransferase [Humisphaera sp.]